MGTNISSMWEGLYWDGLYWVGLYWGGHFSLPRKDPKNGKKEVRFFSTPHQGKEVGKGLGVKDRI
jgi:hypothetical protein